VSIGTPEKLSRFLEMNPHVPRDSILVDDYDHSVYRDTLGFTRFDDFGREKWADLTPSSAVRLVRNLLRFTTTLGPEGVWSYATEGLSLAPTEGRIDWRSLPEGGLRNGGTLVVTGDDVVYRWDDRIPGDVPDVADVLEKAKAAVMVSEEYNN